MSTAKHNLKSAKQRAGVPLRDEIFAVGLVAAGLLFLLCLLSYHPNDASWNTASPSETRNLIGAVGASVADVLLQAFGLAAYPLALILFFAAWRLFHAEALKTRLLRVAGWTLLFIAVCGLLEIAVLRPLVDRSFLPGGLTGAVTVALLSYGFATVGTTIVLLSVMAVGVLLATNFSFASTLDKVRTEGLHLNFFETLQSRFNEWRAQRGEAAQTRAAQRQAFRDERTARHDKQAKKPTPAERVAAFMRDTETLTDDSAPHVKRETNTTGDDSSIATPPASNDFTPKKKDAKSLSSTLLETNPAPAPVIVPRALSNVAGDTNFDTDVDDDVDRENDFAALADDTDAPVMNRASSAARSTKTASHSIDVVRVDSTDAVKDEVSADAASDAESFEPPREYEIPPLDFLKPAPPRHEQADAELLDLAATLEEKCKEFNVTGKVEHICPGPVVTTYEFKPNAGVKYSRITGLVDDLCLALKSESIRIDRLPGKAHVGIEVPNPNRETIFMREVIESRAFRESASKLTLALGKTIDGLNYVADLAKMPHLLIAGATGTGKSVCLNSLVISILYKATPQDVKFIMVDPKRLELGLYADIPHLATPIITEPKRAANALRWAVREMEDRYKRLARFGVRNLEGYNAEIRRRADLGETEDDGTPFKNLPLLVIIIDELADLMMVSGHEVEESITRLAQMARAVGIHLILATQRPSVDVITGLIKANFPSRISFRVSSKVDSRTILDTNGSEGLLGRGDMLFLPPGTSRLVRVHGAYLDETEVSKIVEHIKRQSQPQYDDSITQSDEEAQGEDGLASGERDELFDQALRICVEMKRASTSVLQRRLRIGYGRAAAILDNMERDGLIGPVDGARPRTVMPRAYETVTQWDSFDDAHG